MIVTGIALLVGIGVLVAHRSGSTGHHDLTSRQEDVAARGAHVMPFDQNTTTHMFKKASDGGVETVTANVPSDTAQVGLVRMHLAHEADLFATGDFGDPTAIHGSNMPGLADLEHGAGRIHFDYADVPGGAKITYTTGDSALVSAIHHWFDAQLADHVSHAHG